MPSRSKLPLNGNRPVGSGTHWRLDIAKLHTAAMFDWNDLKYFLAFARNGSTPAVAKESRGDQSIVQRRA